MRFPRSEKERGFFVCCKQIKMFTTRIELCTKLIYFNLKSNYFYTI
jgi:hypothetical protein